MYLIESWITETFKSLLEHRTAGRKISCQPCRIFVEIQPCNLVTLWGQMLCLKSDILLVPAEKKWRFLLKGHSKRLYLSVKELYGKTWYGRDIGKLKLNQMTYKITSKKAYEFWYTQDILYRVDSYFWDINHLQSAFV